MIIQFKDRINKKLGNKGMFLCKMYKNGFDVPNGFILDTDTYDEIISPVEKDIKKLLNSINPDSINNENIKEISKRLTSLFENITVNDSIKNEIDLLIDDRKSYAVRSSGSLEDLDELSFAGQYETFLNISGLEDICKNIVLCYKSMFSERILTYLKNGNLNMDSMKMSVVIQEMVDADYSGVCFTVNPVTGNDKEFLTEITEGLGEKLVSGMVKPKQFIYNWYDGKLKTFEEGYFKEDFVVDMMSCFLKIQEYFGYPTDIEFAIKNNKLYILQARPITTIKYSGITDMWTTADFKDGGVSATVCTPYMWSLYEYIWEYSLRKFILDSKILKKSEVDKKLGDMFYGRPYWNLSVVKLLMSRIIGYKEREFDSEFGVKINYEGDGHTTGVTFFALVRIIKIALAQSKIVRERRNTAQSLKEDLLDKYENYRIKLDKEYSFKEISGVWYKLTHDDYLYSETTYFWQIFINTIHQALYKDSLLKYISESEYLSMLSGLDNISHLLPFYDMWEGTRVIRRDLERYDFLVNNNCEFIYNNIIKFPEITEFMEKYGYHSDKELDVTYPCYYEDYTTVINMFKDTVLLDDKYSPVDDKERQKHEFNKALSIIKSKVSHKKYLKIEDKVVNMRKMLWWREEFRDVSTRFYYIIRMYTMKLAKSLVQEGIIAELDDIWMLKVSHIWDFLNDKKSREDLDGIISKNKSYYNSFRNYISENEIGRIFSSANTKKPKEGGLSGLGCNNGKARGVARVINSLSEIDRLREGDILVTKYTDTGWTCKFALLSGIITEYGGILCHAAVVSREYGIPCIVCCDNAMKIIPDGSIIEMDAISGRVEIIER